MDAQSTAGVAALVGGLGWVGKLLIMAVQGGPDPSSVPESVAFFAGLAGVVVASAAGGAWLARRRSVVWRAGAAVVAVVMAATVVGLGQAALTALPGDVWIQSEAVFGIVGVLALGVAAGSLARPSGARTTARA